ncbi:MAG: presenilin family intramembrane aspartyl protease [Candidatus Ranarchaeia archaeon]
MSNPDSENTKTKKFPIEIGYTLPIILTLVISGSISMINYLSIGLIQVLPFDPGQFQGDQATPAILNTFFYFGFALIGAFFILYLLRKRKAMLIKLVFFSALAFSSSLILLLFFNSVSVIFQLSYTTEMIFFASAGVLGLCLTYFMTSIPAGHVIRNSATIIMGALIGSFLGPNIPTWTLLLLLVVLSFYDIYAVKKGPIKEMVETLEDAEKDEGDDLDFPMLTYVSKEWEIGIGDLAFYSAFTSNIIIHFGTIGGTFVSVGIIIGAIITLKQLDKHKLLPGLPLSIFLGIIFLFFFMGFTILGFL